VNNRKKIYFKDAILFNLNCYENKKKKKQKTKSGELSG
jgi:hypothetical protein